MYFLCLASLLSLFEQVKVAKLFLYCCWLFRLLCEVSGLRSLMHKVSDFIFKCSNSSMWYKSDFLCNGLIDF